MATARNLLIVEDDSEWCGIYVRSAERQGLRAVKIAKDLAEAVALIDEMQFAMAFIDIGLNISDDRNADGLRVMDKIRTVHDETSIVVVTGRSGKDVLPITRDAIMRYGAHDILSKVEITPDQIDERLRTGLEAFEKRSSLTAKPAHAVLKGDLDPLKWDNQMMRETGVRRGVQGLYDFLDELVSGFLPLVPAKPGAAVAKDQATSVMNGPYWSRSTGAAVVVCFAAEEEAKSHIDPAKAVGRLLGKYDVGAVLKESAAHGVKGAVFALSGMQRDSFTEVEC